MLALVANAGEFFGAIAAIVGFLWGAYRYVVKPSWAVVTRIDSRIEGLEKSVGTNGGMTIFDKLEQHGEQLARVASLSDVLNVATFETDALGRITSANDACERLTGISVIELRHMDWVVTLDPTERHAFVIDWMQAIEQRRSFSRAVTMIGRGGPVRVQVRADPIVSGARVIGWRGVMERVVG